MANQLSQEEIDALLGGGGDDDNTSNVDSSALSNEEKDALGEIGNISMGTAATTLFTLLNKKVSITTPKVSITTIAELAKEFFDPSVLIHITYKVGIKGENLLLLKVRDVQIITDLMMGGDGTTASTELNEMHLSAISEAMNQMIGSSSTSLSEMLGEKVDISPPVAYHKSIAETDFSTFGIDENAPVVKIAFNMTVDTLIDSEIMQILPVDVAKQLVSSMLNQSTKTEEVKETPKKESAPAPAAEKPKPSAAAASQQPAKPKPVINAAPVEFESFDENSSGMYYNNDIEIIKDVPLEITVQLGKTGKRINEILDFGVGSVIELDRLVGDHLDILANGRRIAKGEVVVVDENYGVRITDIIIPKKLV